MSTIGSIELPLPPTANNLFLNVRGRGRVPSKQYTAWRKLVAPILASVPPVDRTPVEVRIEVLAGKKWRRNSDIDNRARAVLDALVSAGILPDDTCEHVQRVIIEFVPEPPTKPRDRQPARVRGAVSPLHAIRATATTNRPAVRNPE